MPPPTTLPPSSRSLVQNSMHPVVRCVCFLIALATRSQKVMLSRRIEKLCARQLCPQQSVMAKEMGGSSLEGKLFQLFARCCSMAGARYVQGSPLLHQHEVTARATDPSCVRNTASPKTRQGCVHRIHQAKVHCTVCGWRYNLATNTRVALEDASRLPESQLGKTCWHAGDKETHRDSSSSSSSSCFSFIFVEWDVAVGQCERVSGVVTLRLLSGG